jgi:hypothetical protein
MGGAGPVSSSGSVPSAHTVTTTASTILAANANRLEAIVVNTSTVPILLGLGQTPTATAYDVALSACTVTNDGSGGVYVSDIWKGAIEGIVATGSGVAVVTELS